MKYALCAMAYSCLTLKNFYQEIQLVTDDAGCELLIDRLGLPYSEVKLYLNDFDADPNLWALAKVFAYSKQTDPFIHVDNDIFIWDKFPDAIEKADLCCQNIESLSSDYLEGLSLIKDSGLSQKGIFRELSQSCLDNNACYSINAGILGGNDLGFINEYFNTVIRGCLECRNEISHIGEHVGLMNIVLEQLCFGILSQQKNMRIEFLKHISDFDELVNNIIDIYSAPIKTKFVHCLGSIKKDIAISKQIEYRLRYHHPDYYDRIIRYCKKSSIQFDTKNDDYHIFEKAYSVLSSFNESGTIMNTVRFRLCPGAHIHKSNGITYFETPTSKKILSGWGRILTTLNEPRTGNEIVEVMSTGLIKYFNKNEIYDNVLSYLIHTLFRGNVIETI